MFKFLFSIALLALVAGACRKEERKLYDLLAGHWHLTKTQLFIDGREQQTNLNAGATINIDIPKSGRFKRDAWHLLVEETWVFGIQRRDSTLIQIDEDNMRLLLDADQDPSTTADQNYLAIHQLDDTLFIYSVDVSYAPDPTVYTTRFTSKRMP